MGKLRLAILGLGNCASSLIQGIYYYRDNRTDLGLLYPEIGGYRPQDIEVVAAFDVNAQKVGKDLSEAIWEEPNNTEKLWDVPKTGVEVLMGPVMDGVPEHLARMMEVADEKPVNVAEVLKAEKVDVVMNIIPTGSQEATRHYAEQTIKSGVAFVNGIPELIVSGSQEFEEMSRVYGVPLVGDDFKSQLGATILNREIINLFLARGVKLDNAYQLNYAGNTDFVNLVFRGESKHVTKTSALKSLLPYEAEISTGFTYIPVQKDRKIARIELNGRKWGGAPVRVSAELSVNDSADAGGVMVDMIRCAKFALDRGLSGRLESVSAYYAKHPPVQYPDHIAKQMLDDFIAGKRDS